MGPFSSYSHSASPPHHPSAHSHVCRAIPRCLAACSQTETLPKRHAAWCVSDSLFDSKTSGKKKQHVLRSRAAHGAALSLTSRRRPSRRARANVPTRFPNKRACETLWKAVRSTGRAPGRSARCGRTQNCFRRRGGSLLIGSLAAAEWSTHRVAPAATSQLIKLTSCRCKVSVCNCGVSRLKNRSLHESYCLRRNKLINLATVLFSTQKTKGSTSSLEPDWNCLDWDHRWG